MVTMRVQARRLSPDCQTARARAEWHHGGVGPSQYDTALGPLTALAAITVLVLLCRWVFSTTDRDRRSARRRAAVLSRGDYGLLVPVATVRTAEDAELLREVLAGQRIRATITTGDDGLRTVLVFRRDQEQARQLVD